MQTLYSMRQAQSDNLEKEEKFLFQSIENVQDLYLIMVSILVEIQAKEDTLIEISRNKHLVTKEEKNPNLKFVNNKILTILAQSRSLLTALEDRRINNWKLNDDYILILLKDIKESTLYSDYMRSTKSDFDEDRDFIASVFADIIAPNIKLYEYLEDQKLTWIDDIPIINTLILKQLNAIKNTENGNFYVPKLYKDTEDKEFVGNLFRKVALNDQQLAKEFADKTPNWEADRIAEIDTIILKMAICEFLKFPSIPVKVTINEYLELAKEYSTPKSSIFINGILDNLVKEFESNDKLKKTGRGLM
ncbi:transcription antitermination factor NusB [Flavobacterium psychrophilum]|uniref:N utilization substance protein B homolog (NusB protein) n=2 Tax=Flavobacterium psychrophilum TaxID=96345 RepID=A6GX17_FLAPJ|nr:transcription antitermination factor NusB [Flavobacterium psychrophilum]AIG29443.1 antitermination protein NusB [Flavobacterium psychrophilum]AIG31720.1 antitermination protein NusB [Flavobacterium psychrophilum]AIG33874.1 antitermination protein NusB [Flavobacterium psychrophilum]AIG36236.1 antitermination protein NusB [Flavobacterium psychrophilum]AIG38502.1 antitermination protein NusB [Flavobacterium psychrophilum]